MVNNYGNPYFNQYGQIPSYQQPQLSQQQVTKVNGENGARAFAMGANSSALLLDECGTIVWLKCTDGAGYATVTPYDISPHKTVQQQEYSSLETRISKLEELVNEYTTNTSATPRKNNAKPVSTSSSAD